MSLLDKDPVLAPDEQRLVDHFTPLFKADYRATKQKLADASRAVMEKGLVDHFRESPAKADPGDPSRSGPAKTTPAGPPAPEAGGDPDVEDLKAWIQAKGCDHVAQLMRVASERGVGQGMDEAAARKREFDSLTTAERLERGINPFATYKGSSF